MATPKTFTDGSTDVDEANLNLFLRTGKLQVKTNYAYIDFVASSNAVTVDSGHDSDGEIVSGDCTWNAGSVRIDITLSGFTALPVVAVTIGENASTNVDKMWALASLATNIQVFFKSSATPGASVDPDGDVSFNLFVLGV